MYTAHIQDTEVNTVRHVNRRIDKEKTYFISASRHALFMDRCLSHLHKLSDKQGNWGE